MSKEKKIRLKVVEAQQDDAYKGIARIDNEIMRELGVRRGDAILIKGNRETIAIADRAYPADVGEGIIRIDGILRKNAKAGIGDVVIVEKADVKEAKKIVIAPAQKGIMVQGEPEHLRNGLLGRTVVKGDVVVLGGVQRRKDLMSDFNELGDIFGDIFNNMSFGGLGGGITQIRFVVISASPNGPVQITENTEVTLNSKAVELTEENLPEITYEDIGGLSDEIKKIREMVELPLKHPEIFHKLGIEPPKGVLLHGPPGTGKTLLARAVANESEANFMLLNGPEIMSKYYGESEKKIRDVFEEAEKNSPSIIFIDEIDSIAPKREDVSGEVERRVVSQILTMMDGLKSRGKVIVIGATNRVNVLDPALRRPGRFDREININVPDKHGRLAILKIHTRGMPLKNVKLEEIARMTHGFVGADLESLAKEAAMNVLRKYLPEMKLDGDEQIPLEVLEKLIIKHDDFTDALKVVRPSAMREVLVETPNVGWDDVGGLDQIRNDLMEAVEWPLKNADCFKRMGIRPSRGILLYGPPGTGKTLLAKAVAKESEANFIQVKGPSLLSMWVGKSLPYSEELIVKEGNRTRRMKIGDIVEKKADVQVLAFDKDKKIKFSRITDFIKHKLEGSKLMEVTTRTGRKIKVTEDHSLFSFINGKITDVPTSNLIPNESYIVVPKNLNLPREIIKEINLYEHFKDDKDIFVSNVSSYLEDAKKILGLEKTANILNISKKYLADIVYKNLPVSIINFDALIKESRLMVNFDEIKIKLKGSTHEYPSLFGLNKNFWRLVGLWIAEGDFNSSTIRIHNQNPEIRQDIKNICLEYGFNISETDSNVTINSFFMEKVFRNVFGLKSGASSKNLPELAFILDKESKANLLKGYFSGDGSIHQVERGKFQIEASTISRTLANDLLYMLLDFGIVATCYLKKSDRYNNEFYRISILGVKNFEKFTDIGFIDNVRNRRILQYIGSRKWVRSDIIPLSGELYELASNSNHVYSTNKSIGKEALKDMLILVDRDKTKYREYWDLAESDLYFDLVKEIKTIKSEEYVYDIEVGGEHNFVSGFGGVIAHNSEEGVRKIFERARQVAPCIIFFDEVDSLAGKRGQETGTKVTERVLNQILAEMDGLEGLNDVLIIAATNRPDLLDSALLRPGRFDKILLVNAPTEAGRKKILEVHTKKMPLAKDVNLTDVAKRTDGHTGADLEAVTREAAMLALRENMNCKDVKKKHFDEALKKIKPSVTKQTIDVYKKVEESFIKSAKSAIPMGNSYLG